MEESSWQVPAMLFAAIIAITLVSFGVARLREGKRRLGAWMLVGGVLAIALPVGATVAWDEYQEWASWEHTVSVQGLDAMGAHEFTVDIRHQADSIVYLADSERRQADEHSFTYTFRDAGEVDDVLAEFREQHPDGVEGITRPYVHGDYGSVWHVYLEGARYDLFDQEDGSFVAATQIAAIDEDDDAEPAFIPFPSGSSPRAVFAGATTHLTDITMAEWNEFYGPIDGVEIVGTSISVPTSDGRTATLDFVEEPDDSRLGFTVTLSD